MSAFIIIPVLLLAIIAFAVFHWQRRLSDKTLEQPRTVHSDSSGLFAVDERTMAQRPLKKRPDEESVEPTDLLTRAQTGDLQTLIEAESMGKKDIYYRVLDALTDWVSESPEQLKMLIHILLTTMLCARMEFSRKV